MFLAAAVMLAAADTTPPAAATSSAAGSAVQSSAPAPDKSKPKATDQVCWQEQPTGSHFSKRVCTTRGELELRQRQDQEAISQHARTVPSGFGH